MKEYAMRACGSERGDNSKYMGIGGLKASLLFFFYADTYFVFSARRGFSCERACKMRIRIRTNTTVYKNGATAAPAESGYPCGAWLGRHSEIDVILITREVAYHKGPGPVVRPFVLCTRVAIHTHNRARIPCFPLIGFLTLSFSLFFSELSFCVSPLCKRRKQ